MVKPWSLDNFDPDKYHVICYNKEGKRYLSDPCDTMAEAKAKAVLIRLSRYTVDYITVKGQMYKAFE